MKKTAFILAFVLLAAAQSVMALELTEGTFADARARAASLNKPLLVEFYADW